ncbi:hypothetical protein V6N12_018605 [Hibiscus sabdariffa]|uniref:RNase H type-1 domain-containing protein n=1 Tax=Hibiscus sabdariffa TaxID=183260 RepID=A0ABR2AKM5_9ROSI
MGRPSDNPLDDLGLIFLEKQDSASIPGVGASMVGDSLEELPMVDAVVETDPVITNVVASTMTAPTVSFWGILVGATPVQSREIQIPDLDVDIHPEDVRMRTVDGTPVIDCFERVIQGEVRKENDQVWRSKNVADLPQKDNRAKTVVGKKSQGVKNLANKKVGGLKSNVSTKPSIRGMNVVRKVITVNGDEDGGENNGIGSTISTRVASKDMVVAVPSSLNLENHTVIKVVSQGASSSKLSVAEKRVGEGSKLGVPSFERRVSNIKNVARRNPYPQRALDRSEVEVDEWIRKLSHELSASGTGNVVNLVNQLEHNVQTDFLFSGVITMFLMVMGKLNEWVFFSLPLQEWLVHNLEFNGSNAGMDYVERDWLIEECKIFLEQVKLAKSWAILHGLQYVWRQGYRRVIIESGCREAEVQVRHIFRKSNTMVDWLAKTLRNHMVNTVFFEEPLDGTRSLLEFDLQNHNVNYG